MKINSSTSLFLSLLVLLPISMPAWSMSGTPLVDNSNSQLINGTYQEEHPGKMVLHDLFFANDFLDEYRIPSIIQTHQGTLIAAAEKREANGDKASNDIVIRTSTDGGYLWSSELTVATDQISFNDPNLFVANNGTVFIFFNAIPSKAGSVIGNPTGMRTGGGYYVYSEDEGANWSDVTLLTTERPADARSYSTSPGQSIVLKNGNHKGQVVMPIRVNYTQSGVTGGLMADVDIRAGTLKLEVHSDNSLSYSFGNTNPNAEVNEFQLVEMGSGDKLYYLSRNTDGFSWNKTSRTLYATSNDNGKNWNDNKSFGFFSTRTQSGLLRSNYNNQIRYYYSTPTGEYNYSKGRHEGYIFVTTPQGGGVTWKNSRKTLITGKYFGNSTLVDMGDRIGLIYEFSDDKTGLNVGKVQRIRFMSLTKDLIHSGENAWPTP